MASQGTPGFQTTPTAQLSISNVGSNMLPPVNSGINTSGAWRSPFQVPTPSFAPPTTSLSAISGSTIPPIQQVEHIIPNEDPQCPVDLGDDDNEDKGEGEGVWSEDLDEAEGDEGDDEGVPN